MTRDVSTVKEFAYLHCNARNFPQRRLVPFALLPAKSCMPRVQPSRSVPMKILLWIIAIIFLIGLLVVTGVLNLIF